MPGAAGQNPPDAAAVALVLLPRGATLGLACGIGAGVPALVSVVRHGERGLLVGAALRPLVTAAAVLVAEIVAPHG